MESDLDPKLSEINCVLEAQLIFWDFDGVIKDSVEVKSTAFEKLFSPYGHKIATKVKQHHESNGGMSRFDKMPLYLCWAGESATDAQVQEFCIRFSKLALKAVIDSPWVLGVREFLLNRCKQQYFVLVTATPQEEIQHILDVLDIAVCFREVYGAPRKKSDSIRDVLRRLNYHPDRALVIGDAETDLMAAHDNAVSFLLRRTPLNKALQASYAGPIFDNLAHEQTDHN